MELIENLLQLLVTFVGALLSGIFYWKSRRQADFLLLCFYGCFALGAFYWTLYLLLFNTTPHVFYVSEFGWRASSSCTFCKKLSPLRTSAASVAALHGLRLRLACRCWCFTAPSGTFSPT
jgi:hypothetical protein